MFQKIKEYFNKEKKLEIKEKKKQEDLKKYGKTVTVNRIYNKSDL